MTYPFEDVILSSEVEENNQMKGVINLRLKLGFESHNEEYAYIDITITSKEEENIDNEKVFEYIIKNLNTNTWIEFNECHYEEEENEKKNQIEFWGMISFDYERGEMSEKYKEIKEEFKEIKSRIKKMENSSIFKK